MDKERLVFEAERALVSRIDDWRFANRIPSRAEAIRRLVSRALDQSGIKNGTAENHGRSEKSR